MVLYDHSSQWLLIIFFSGGSSGSAMYVALQVAKTLKKGQRLVVVLPDGIRNYMSKFVQDEWMLDKGYVSQHDMDVIDQN